jgi:hypothetical protein
MDVHRFHHTPSRLDCVCLQLARPDELFSSTVAIVDRGYVASRPVAGVLPVDASLAVVYVRLTIALICGNEL